MFYTMLYWDLKNSLQNTLYYLYGICYVMLFSKYSIFTSNCSMIISSQDETGFM